MEAVSCHKRGQLLPRALTHHHKKGKEPCGSGFRSQSIEAPSSDTQSQPRFKLSKKLFFCRRSRCAAERRKSSLWETCRV
eukprot:6175968-Pleurochrysis_carterae.AAC.1